MGIKELIETFGDKFFYKDERVKVKKLPKKKVYKNLKSKKIFWNF
jgi:hypothetical protein